MRQCLLGLALLLLAVALLLPSHALAQLRDNQPLLGMPLNWLEGLWPGGADLEHVAAFAAIALFWCLVARPIHWWRPAVGLGAIAVATELLQFVVPGRTPLLGDARDDLLGVAVGMILAWLIAWPAGQLKKRRLVAP